MDYSDAMAALDIEATLEKMISIIDAIDPNQEPCSWPMSTVRELLVLVLQLTSRFVDPDDVVDAMEILADNNIMFNREHQLSDGDIAAWNVLDAAYKGLCKKRLEWTLTRGGNSYAVRLGRKYAKLQLAEAEPKVVA